MNECVFRRILYCTSLRAISLSSPGRRLFASSATSLHSFATWWKNARTTWFELRCAPCVQQCCSFPPFPPNRVVFESRRGNAEGLARRNLVAMDWSGRLESQTGLGRCYVKVGCANRRTCSAHLESSRHLWTKDLLLIFTTPFLISLWRAPRLCVRFHGDYSIELLVCLRLLSR